MGQSGSFAHIGLVRFMGHWDASSNAGTGSNVAGGVTTGPYTDLFNNSGYAANVISYDSSGTMTPRNGDYWQVHTAGNVSINSNTGWDVNDWIIYSGSTWIKMDIEDTVASLVTGFTTPLLSVSRETGNVGVGTLSARTSFEIAKDLPTSVTGGQISISEGSADATYSMHLGFSKDSDSRAFVANLEDDDGAKFGIRMKGAAPSNEVMTVLGSGNVGIGTATPTKKLDIDGDLHFSPTVISTAHITTAGSLRLRCTDAMWIGDNDADAIRIGRTNTALAPIYLRSGGDNDLVVSGGKVGIGIESPSVSLEIDGDIKLSPTTISTAHITTAGSLTIRADANMLIGDSGVDSIKIGRTNTAFARIHLRSGGANDFVVSNSMVGVGTDSPATKLHVAGAAAATGTTAGAPAFTFVGDTDTGMYSGGANALKFSTGGSLALTISSAQLATFSGDMIIAGDLTVSGDTITQNVSTIVAEDKDIVLGVSGTSQAASYSAASPGVITKASHGLANGNVVYVSGDSGSEFADGIYTVANATTNTFTLGENTSATGTLNYQAQSESSVNGAGILIPGTSVHSITYANSTGDFDITENVDIASGKAYKVAGTSVLNATTLGSGVVSSSLTSLGTLTALTGGTGDLVWDTDTLVVDSSTDRVGINTASPSAALEIDGDIKLSPTAISTAHITTAGSLAIRADANMLIGDSGVDSIKIGRTNTAYARIHLRSGGDDDFVVSNSKVGIGVNDPDTALEVFNTSTQLKLSYDADGFATFAVDSSGFLTIASSGDGGAAGQTSLTDNVIIGASNQGGTSCTILGETVISGPQAALGITATEGAAAVITLTADEGDDGAADIATITQADSGDLTIDTGGDIVLDADGGDIFFKDAGTTFGSATNTSGNLIIKSGTTTALTFSGANVTSAGVVAATGLTVSDGGNIGSTSDTDAIQIGAVGDVKLTAGNLEFGTADKGIKMTAASGTDADGLVMKITGGTSTGTGEAGEIEFLVGGSAGGSSSSVNAASTVMKIYQTEVLLGSGSGDGILSSNGTQNLVLRTNSGTNSGTITITDGADGDITLAPNGTGKVAVGSGSGAAYLMSNGTQDLVLVTSGTGPTLTLTDGSNGGISLEAHGTGDVTVNADTLRIGDQNADATLTTWGTGDLTLNTNSGTNSGAITIADAANGNISISPNGTGLVLLPTNTRLKWTDANGPFIKGDSQGQLTFGTIADYMGFYFHSDAQYGASLSIASNFADASVDSGAPKKMGGELKFYNDLGGASSGWGTVANAAEDKVGTISFVGFDAADATENGDEDSTFTETSFAFIEAEITDVSAGDACGKLKLGVSVDDTMTTLVLLDGGVVGSRDPAVTISDVDFEVNNSTTSSANAGGHIRLTSDDGQPMAVGHRLGVIEFAGAEDTGSTHTVGARIEALCDANWANDENGADLLFYTTDGNAAQTERLRIAADGVVSVGAGHIECGNGQDGALEVEATAHNAAGRGLTVSAGATTAGTTNNIAGGDLTLQGGQGKGTGAGGNIIFKVAEADESAGSSLNSLVTAVQIDDSGDLTRTMATNSSGERPKIIVYKSRASAADLQAGDVCGELNFAGRYDGGDVSLGEIEGILPVQPGGGADGMRPHSAHGHAPMMVRTTAYNGEIVTTIMLDLDGDGSGDDNSVAILASSTDAGHVIGENNSTPAYLTRVTSDTTGVVYMGTMSCLEVPTGGEPSVDLVVSTHADKDYDEDPSSRATLVDGGTWTVGKTMNLTIPTDGIQDNYLYLTGGATNGGTYTAGKFIIKLYGASF